MLLKIILTIGDFETVFLHFDNPNAIYRNNSVDFYIKKSVLPLKGLSHEIDFDNIAKN
jgi:hypothetical protein